MNEEATQHPYASPAEVVDETPDHQTTITPGMRTIECTASFVLGLSVMLLVCQLVRFAIWAENVRDIYHYPEATASESELRIWDDYDWTFFSIPALYWIGVFLTAIFGTITTFCSRCSWPATLICLALFPMSAIGFLVAFGTEVAYW